MNLQESKNGLFTEKKTGSVNIRIGAFCLNSNYNYRSYFAVWLKIQFPAEDNDERI